MEDELTTEEAPPTKQQLSENKLFQRFGSLHLDGGTASTSDSAKLDDSDDEEACAPTAPAVSSPNGRKEFDRYVYLLFKDKKSDGHYPVESSGAIERLLREEREKLSKAVILWNPPARSTLIEEADDSSDDDQLSYGDHRDFLKDSGSSVVITEVVEDAPITELDDGEPDDIMLE